ncbi:MFS transporter [Streptomyces endophyticus]|uniref:MFS transporter n=1 Tax=Streptomyces endophyticus TaxID=714166 RepID=A0ABU6FDP2_9ACTN|nr:MFS transporter [Streptomyces endophyticus]MEB8340917.1 MFS transporter [Streptomyces endophyticus]
MTRRTVLGFVGTGVLSLMVANMVPVIIAALQASLGFSIEEAGSTMTAMTGGTVVGMFAVTAIIARSDRPLVARVGLLLIAAGFGLGAVTMTPALVVVGFAVGGLGCGAVSAAAMAASAATTSPDRTVTLTTVLNRVFATALLAAAPLFGTDLRAILTVLALIGVVGFPLAGGLPNSTVSGTTSPAFDDSVPGDQGLGVRPAGTRLAVTAVVLAVSMGCWSLTEDMVYTMAAPLSEHAGVPASGLGPLLAAKVAGGLLGALAAPFVMRRLGRAAALMIIVLVSTLAKVTITLAPGPAVFGVALVLWGILYAAALALVLGMASALDSTGRTGSLVNSVYVVGIGAAPFVGSHLITLIPAWGYALLVAVPSLLFGATLVSIARRHRGLEPEPRGPEHPVAAPDAVAS